MGRLAGLYFHRAGAALISDSVVDRDGSERMTRIPTGSDIGIDDIEVRRVSSPRTNQPPIIVRHAGAVADVIQGPDQNTWGPREMVLCDIYDLHRVGGDSHDAVGIERSGIRPADVKTSTPAHDGRRRNGCFILRESQHAVLRNVPGHLQQDNGFVSDGDYVVCVYEEIGNLIILLDDARVSARDLDRMVSPSFYHREDKKEASVEWTSVPGLDPEEMHARIDAAPVYLRALGEDQDRYADELARVRDRVQQVEADRADHAETDESVEAP